MQALRDVIATEKETQSDFAILNLTDPSMVVHLTDPPVLPNRVNIRLLEQALDQKIVYKPYYEHVNIYEVNRDTIPFAVLCKKCSLPEPFMAKFAKYLDWHAVCQYQRMTTAFMDAHAERLYWPVVFQYQAAPEWWIETVPAFREHLGVIFEHQTLSEAWIDAHGQAWLSTICRHQALSQAWIERRWHSLDETCQKLVCRYQVLTTDFVDGRAGDEFPWTAVSQNARIEMTQRWLAANMDRLDVASLCGAHYMSEALIEGVLDKIDWEALSWNKLDMSEAFLVRHARRVNWRAVAMQYFLDESFVRRFVDAPHVKPDENYLPLDAVLASQELSEAFLRAVVLTHPEHARALMLVATQHQRLSEPFIEAHIRSAAAIGPLGDAEQGAAGADVLNWDYVSLYQPISAAFVDRHADDLNWFNVSMARAMDLGDAFMLKHVDRLYFDQVNSLKAMEFVARKKDPLDQESLLRAIFDRVRFAENPGSGSDSDSDN